MNYPKFTKSNKNLIDISTLRSNEKHSQKNLINPSHSADKKNDNLNMPNNYKYSKKNNIKNKNYIKEIINASVNFESGLLIDSQEKNINKLNSTLDSSECPEPAIEEDLTETLKQIQLGGKDGLENFLEPIAKNDNIILKYMQSKSFEIHPEDTVFCLSVDGSIHSEYATELALKDFLKPKDKLLIVHIYNGQLDKNFNFRNKKSTIIEKYDTIILRLARSKTLFLKEDKISKIHEIEQVNRIASNHDCSFLLTGFYGMRGQTGDNKELLKGLDYLLNYAKTPVIIVKELTLRQSKPKGQFKWLFVFDRNYINSLIILNKFLRLIDKERDYVYGLTLLPTWANFDDIKNRFDQIMQENDIINFDYEQIEYKKSPFEVIKEKVNFSEKEFDFLVFYNNPEKYKSDKEYSYNMSLLIKCACNIGFANGI